MATSSSSSSRHAVRVLERCRVSPPTGSVPQTSIPFTFFDAFWVAVGQVQRLFFYNFHHSTSHFLQHFLPTFKSSLSLALGHFFPLAGRLRTSSGSGHKFEISYADSDSVSLVVAESVDGDFRDLSGNHARRYAKLRPLVADLGDDTGALIALQVTVFSDHGICVGVTISHAACDGAGFVNFVKSWAATCASGGRAPVLVLPPLYDRSLVVDPGRLTAIFSDTAEKMTAAVANMPHGDPTKDELYVCKTFSLTGVDIEMLKRQVLAGAGEGKAPFHCSTFVVACAYTWVCQMRYRGWPAERTAHAMFAVDFRARLSPPVPAGYFGNCIGACYIEAKVGDLVGEDGVRAAAEAFGTAIDGLRGRELNGAEKWGEATLNLLMKQPFSVAGSPKFGVYETDFGWGRPAKVEVTSIKGTGAISMAESRVGGGGIEIGLVLPTLEMEEFSKHFAAGLGLHD